MLGIVFFLFPTTLVILFAWPFFLASFRTRRAFVERRRAAALAGEDAAAASASRSCFLQGVAELIKRIAALRGVADEPIDYERPLQ